MGLSRRQIIVIVHETLEEGTDSLDIDEIEELAGAVAARMLEEDPDTYDDEEEDNDSSDEAVPNPEEL